MSTQAAHRISQRIGVATLLATVLWVIACSDDARNLTGPVDIEAVLILSDTALTSSNVISPGSDGTEGSSAVRTATSNSAATANVAFVSLPPGAVPLGETATILNRRTGDLVTVEVSSGGFDPIGILARSGDLLDIRVFAIDGATLLHVIRAVPGKRPPKVVRTSPPKGKRDVALNATILVVFSEPIDSSTLNETSIRLLRNGQAVTGRVQFQDSAQLSAAFIPAAALVGGTEYQLEITQNIRDVDGEPLEMPVTVEFTTVVSTESAVATRIAFSDLRSISVISADGSGFTRLVDDGGTGWQHMSPAWSPDGRRIAFGSNRDGGWDIYVIDVDGSRLTRLTNGGSRNDEPAWSPDGARIAFTSDRDGDFEIHVMNADGTGIVRLTNDPSQDGNPAWSPDGTRIAFTTDRHGLNELYVMNADGTGETRLTNVDDEAIHPEWSPDGRRILFTRTAAGNFVMNADGTGLRSLNAHGGGATWSPDGNRIVFSNGNLFVINSDGSGLRNLNVQGYEPAWAPADVIVSDPTPSGAAILVDASRDGGVWWFPQSLQQGGFSPKVWHQGAKLAAYFRSRSYRVEELPRPFTITSELLDAYDIVLRAVGFGSYTQEEIAAYQHYVSAGGQLLLVGDHMMNLESDELAVAFGLEFAGITRGENILTIVGDHSVARGAGSISYGVGSALRSYPEAAQIIGRLSAGSYLDLDKNGGQDANEPSAPAVLGVMTYGRGRIVFCGDLNMWHGVPQPLIDNVLDWFETP